MADNILGGVTLYNSLYGAAPPKRGVFGGKG